MAQDNESMEIIVNCLNCNSNILVKRVMVPCNAVMLRSNICPECVDVEGMNNYREWFVDKEGKDFI